ncbi:rRNA maturation RNase YbeY [Fervidobacterium sp.]
MAATIVFFDVPDELIKLIDNYLNELTKIVEDEIADVKIHFIFVDSQTMAQMNQQYRGKEGPTDVLTFVYEDSYENDDLDELDVEETQGLGKIKESELAEEPYAEGYICLDVVKKNAEELNNTFEKELLTVFVHSILHMAGYDHEYDTTNAQEMFAKQKMYVEKLTNEL